MYTGQTKIADLSFDEYTARQLAEISPSRVRERAAMIKASGNFGFDGRKWTPNPYKGYAVVSMVDANPGNELLPFQLSALQDELRRLLTPVDAYYMLPSASFHQTVANTVSAERYYAAIEDNGLEAAYPGIMRDAFAAIPPAGEQDPIRMRLAGLSIFGTSLGLLGVFEQQEHYNRILQFRSGFYSNKKLLELGIHMTRPFIGHITLTYVEKTLTDTDRAHLVTVINALNECIATKNYYFILSSTGLRKYDHLAEFRKETGHPEYLL